MKFSSLISVLFLINLLALGASGQKNKNNRDELTEEEKDPDYYGFYREPPPPPSTPEPIYQDGIDVIPGDPEVDYPILQKIIPTSFSCSGRDPGFYSDPEARCQIWHICDTDERKQSFLCINGTIFSQDKRVCVWWYSTSCEIGQVEKNYEKNRDLYQFEPKNEEIAYSNEKNYKNAPKEPPLKLNLSLQKKFQVTQENQAKNNKEDSYSRENLPNSGEKNNARKAQAQNQDNFNLSREELEKRRQAARDEFYSTAAFIQQENGIKQGPNPTNQRPQNQIFNGKIDSTSQRVQNKNSNDSPNQRAPISQERTNSANQREVVENRAQIPKNTQPSQNKAVFSPDNYVPKEKFRHSTPRKHSVQFSPSPYRQNEENEQQVPQETSFYSRQNQNLNSRNFERRVMEIEPVEEETTTTQAPMRRRTRKRRPIKKPENKENVVLYLGYTPPTTGASYREIERENNKKINGEISTAQISRSVENETKTQYNPESDFVPIRQRARKTQFNPERTQFARKNPKATKTEIVPETDTVSKTESIPERQIEPIYANRPNNQNAPETQFVDDKQSAPKTKYVYDLEFTPNTQSTPITKYVYDLQFAPNAQTTPKSQFTPNAQNSQKTQFAPQTQFAPNAENAPKTQFLPQTQFVPNTQNSQKTQFAPQTQFAPNAQNVAKTQFVPQTQFIPNTQNSQKTQFAPQTQFAPNAQNSPKTQLAPQSQFAQNGQNAPKSQFSPQNQFAQKSQFVPEPQFSEKPKKSFPEVPRGSFSALSAGQSSDIETTKLSPRPKNSPAARIVVKRKFRVNKKDKLGEVRRTANDLTFPSNPHLEKTVDEEFRQVHEPQKRCAVVGSGNTFKVLC